MLRDEVNDGRAKERDNDEVVARERGAVGVATFGSDEVIDTDSIADVVPNDSGEAICDEVDAQTESNIDDINPN